MNYKLQRLYVEEEKEEIIGNLLFDSANIEHIKEIIYSFWKKRKKNERNTRTIEIQCRIQEVRRNIKNEEKLTTTTTKTREYIRE